MSLRSNTFVPHSHIPYGPDGLGFYSENTRPCYHINNAAIPLLVDAIQSTGIQTSSVFTIVDYGAADGGTSMPLMYACVEAIREKYGEELPINIIYEDQAVNDFKSLFMRIQGLIPGTSCYLADFSNVFVTASGTNFYDQCFPCNSVNLGVSAISFHWLSQKPCDLTDGLVVHLNTVPEENEKFREQAANDWERILLRRAAELEPGSKLVCVLLSTNNQNQFSGSPSSLTKEGYHRMFADKWLEMEEDGLLTMEEVKASNFMEYYRTEEELKKPFESTDSPVIQAGLQLVSIETQFFPCQFRKKWMKEKGDAKEHAQRLVASLKSWSYSTFMSGLSDTRSKQEKIQIVDELYRRCEGEVARRPEDYGNDYVVCYLVIQKTEIAK